MKTKEQFDAERHELFLHRRALEAALDALVNDPDGSHRPDEWTSTENEDAAITIAELIVRNRFATVRLFHEEREIKEG